MDTEILEEEERDLIIKVMKELETFFAEHGLKADEDLLETMMILLSRMYESGYLAGKKRTRQ